MSEPRPSYEGMTGEMRWDVMEHGEAERVREALRLAREALRAREYVPVRVGHVIFESVCFWCDVEEPKHSPDCLRQRALGAIEGVSE